jgi:hypothetical protein
MQPIEILNLEKGYPRLEQALQKLKVNLASAKMRQVKFVKVITGWGSHGRGGVIRRSMPQVMPELQKEGLVKEWIPGEKWGIFNPLYLDWFQNFPDLRKDPDLNRCNLGICLVRVS